MSEIQPGTYISTVGLTEEEFHRAVKAFEDAWRPSRYVGDFGDRSFLGIDLDGDIIQWDTGFLPFHNVPDKFTQITYAELVGEDKPIAKNEQCNERSKHPQFDLIEKYYREWGKWDCYGKGHDGEWSYVSYPDWPEEVVYELRPRKKMMKIGDYAFREPEREAPEVWTDYFLPDIDRWEYFAKIRWAGDGCDIKRFNRGLIHLTKEAAIAHAKAMILASGGKVDE